MKGQSISGVARYVANHWQGNHGLAWSFWVNFLALRLVLFLFQEGGTLALPPGMLLPLWLVVPLVIVAHGGIFLWQAVGLLRAADKFSQSSGQMFKVWGTQLALIVAALWVLSYSLEAWHLTQPHPDDALPSLADFDQQRQARYSLSIAPGQTLLVFEGTLELGVTKRLAGLLDAHPSIATIRLDSPGGNVFEARGLASQIRARGLDTLVQGECSSACTLVFVGGANRSIATEARLGFHQYRLDTDQAALAVDIRKEQERDMATFRQAGVAPWFLERLYQSGSQHMWYPTTRDLIDAGVATRVVQSARDTD